MANGSVLADVADSLLRSRFDAFVGAGLSVGSGIPLADGFQRFVLSRVGFSEEEARAFLTLQLPFESFVEVLVKDADLKGITPVFSGRQHTRNHTLLARLCGGGYLSTILTTNFDTLLESALDTERVPVCASVDTQNRPLMDA